MKARLKSLDEIIKSEKVEGVYGSFIYFKDGAFCPENYKEVLGKTIEVEKTDNYKNFKYSWGVCGLKEKWLIFPIDKTFEELEVGDYVELNYNAPDGFAGNIYLYKKEVKKGKGIVIDKNGKEYFIPKGWIKLKKDKCDFWKNIEVDTPVLVKVDSGYKKRYFAEFKDGKVAVFGAGTTSWSAKKNERFWYSAEKVSIAEENKKNKEHYSDDEIEQIWDWLKIGKNDFSCSCLNLPIKPLGTEGSLSKSTMREDISEKFINSVLNLTVFPINISKELKEESMLKKYNLENKTLSKIQYEILKQKVEKGDWICDAFDCDECYFKECIEKEEAKKLLEEYIEEKLNKKLENMKK